MELENLVRFSTYPRPFLVKELFCNNPNCHCNEAFLSFTEVSDSGGSLENPLSFSVRVHLDTWQESEPPQRSPEVTAWIQEFLAQCPLARRAEYKASYEEGRRIAKRRSEFTIAPDEVLDGTLLSYANIETPQSALSAGGTAYTFDVHYQGREYLVEDRYCVNPECDCQSVHLEFFEAVTRSDGRLLLYQRFLGKVTFAGRLVVEERTDCNRAEAKAVLSAWWQEHEHELKLLKARYQEVKEIGRRSLAARPTSGRLAMRRKTQQIAEGVSQADQWPGNDQWLPDEQRPLGDPSTASPKIGRNAICPCGSGKKYKKCCLPKASMAR